MKLWIKIHKSESQKKNKKEKNNKTKEKFTILSLFYIDKVNSERRRMKKKHHFVKNRRKFCRAEIWRIFALLSTITERGGKCLVWKKRFSALLFHLRKINNFYFNIDFLLFSTNFRFLSLPLLIVYLKRLVRQLKIGINKTSNSVKNFDLMTKQTRGSREREQKTRWKLEKSIRTKKRKEEENRENVNSWNTSGKDK